MKQIISKNKKYLGYSLYCILLIAGLLYYRFPSDAFRDYLPAAAEKRFPGHHVSIEEISPSLSIGIRLLKPVLSCKADPDKILFKAHNVLIRPDILSLLKGKSVYCFEGLAYNGSIAGRIHLENKGPNASFETSIEFNEMLIDDWRWLSQMTGREIKGTLDGILTCRGQSGSQVFGTGQANLKLSNGSLELNQPILNIKSLDFNELHAEVVLKDRKLSLKDVEFKGPGLKGRLSGDIVLKKDLMTSRINLKGTIGLHVNSGSKGKKGLAPIIFLKRMTRKENLPFVINGTLSRPRFRIL